jgi:AcrR family transcriptional regulator
MPVEASEPAPNARSVRTRSALIQAGLKLFAERPIDAVPIDDIVAAAGVAKGSFFNHFDDKPRFANAIATEIRHDIEARVAKANCATIDPLERLTGGMVVVVDFALSQRERAIVMLRGAAFSTAKDHPLNAGLRNDIDACVAGGLFNHEARNTGLLLWLGAGQMLMASVIKQRLSRVEAAECMREMIVMALLGLGVDAAQARHLANGCVSAPAEQLETR